MPPEQPVPDDETFAALVQAFVRDRSREDPASASLAGLTEWDAEAADMSETGMNAVDEAKRSWLQTFEAVDAAALSRAQRIDRELILARVGVEIANADYQPWRRSVEPYLWAVSVFGLFVHRARPQAEAVAAAIARLGHVPDTVAAAIENLSADLAHPQILHRDLLSLRGETGFLRGELADFVTEPALQASLRAAAEPAARELERLAAHVEKLARQAHGDFAFGRQRYDNLLRIGEQLDLDVEALRDLGWVEYRALDAQMAEVATRIGGSSDWRTLLDRLVREHAADMGELRHEYAEATARARAFVVDRRLMTLPEGEECDVRPAPAFLAALVVASYEPSAPFLSGTHGTFNIPVTPPGATAGEVEDRLRSNAHHEIPATAVHEAYGGHHAHFVRMALANPLRQFLQSEYFVEGWALYFEKVAWEEGFYRNDTEVFGWLASRIMRAARVVVDTSLHLGEMTIEEAAEFMRTKAGLPAAVARGEAERYAAWPTQASAYLTGAIAIERSRDRWLAEGHGSLQEFHDAITASGALPPGLAARAIGLTA